MTRLLIFGISAIVLLAESQLPDSVLGKWRVGKPYDDLGQPIGLDAKQEGKIIGLIIEISRDQIAVCGKEIQIKSIDVERLTNDKFLAKYNFTPNRIGFSDKDVIDVTLNKLHSTKACGEFADPGTNLFISNRHAVVEIGNDYFQLTR